MGTYFHRSLDEPAVYDPTTRVWQALPGGMGSYATATLLSNGDVLELGGIGLGNEFVVASRFKSLAHASQFEPDTQVHLELGSHAHAGSNAAAAVLGDGRILVAGGDISRIPNSLKATASVDVFDPVTRAWAPAAAIATARSFHTATTLDDGEVLLVGGQNSFLLGVFATAERYNADTQDWRAAGSMSIPRYRHTASLLRRRSRPRRRRQRFERVLQLHHVPECCRRLRS